MMRYSVQPRGRIFVKGCNNLSKNMSKNTSKNLSGKYSQKHLDHAKRSETAVPESSSKRVIQKTAEATGDLSSNKIADTVAKPYDGRTTKVSEKFTTKYFRHSYKWE